ncbi:MAG: hypothetical protein AAF690_26260 [Acidobacteriota bacterium]
MSDWTPEAVERVQREVLRRASSDSEFRQFCLDNPAGAVKSVSGMEIPENVPTIRFVEKREEMVFVLPPSGDTLSDADLQQISGGATMSVLLGGDYGGGGSK